MDKTALLRLSNGCKLVVRSAEIKTMCRTLITIISVVPPTAAVVERLAAVAFAARSAIDAIWR